MARSSRPFRFNPKLAARNAKLLRLINKGLLGPDLDKAAQRHTATTAAAAHTITTIPAGKRARSKPFDVMD